MLGAVLAAVLAVGAVAFAARRTLLVVQNFLNQIAVVKLDADYRSGRVVRTIEHEDFDVPTTVARKRGSLYLPNARFRPPGTPPETEFWVTRVGR